jgi:hypothetical protein
MTKQEKERKMGETDEDVRYQAMCHEMKEAAPREALWLFETLAKRVQSFSRFLAENPVTYDKRIDAFIAAAEELLTHTGCLNQQMTNDALAALPEYKEALKSGLQSHAFNLSIAYALMGFVYERICDYYGDVDEVKTACLAAFKHDSPERFIEMWAAVQDVLPVFIGQIGFLEFENDMLGLSRTIHGTWQTDSEEDKAKTQTRKERRSRSG